MSDNKNWGETVVGWFIVKDEDQHNPSAAASEADLTADELIAKYADQTPLGADSGAASSSEISAAPPQTDNFVPSTYVTPRPSKMVKSILKPSMKPAESTRKNASASKKRSPCSRLCRRRLISRRRNKSSKRR